MYFGKRCTHAKGFDSVSLAYPYTYINIKRGVKIVRLPNGYGSVVKLSGNRRKPFMVRKTKGFDHKAHPIYTIIGYTETREEGLQLLAEYNKNPYDVDASKITLKELFEKYLKTKKYNKYSSGSRESLNVCFNKSVDLHATPYKEIKAYHMQEIVDESGGYSSQGAMRTFFKHLDDYAHELDICNNKYSQLITTDKISPKKKTPFNMEEIDALWNNLHLRGADDILILLYSGFRINEFLELLVKNINLEERTMKGGNKTETGKNRIVPIHPRIFPLIENKLKTNRSTHLIHYPNKLTKVSYHDYRKMFFDPTLTTLEISHVPHETRHTFRSRLDSAGGNKVSIDLLMGHASSSVGEKVYTHKTLDELRETIELLD